MTRSHIISVGLAMFAMLFGAGNVAWPLVLGRDVGDKILFGLGGFICIGVIVPLLGLLSVMLCDGDYRKLLGRLGTVPANLIVMLCMIMIGPFMGIPRCVTLSHASIKLYAPQFTLLLYSIFTAALLFVFTVRRSMVIDILGKYLGPIKLALLLAIIVKGIFAPATFVMVGISPVDGFFQGVANGMLTGDLLGTIFFSGLIFSNIKSHMGADFNYKKLTIFGLKAGFVGASLLGIVYAGFCFVAAFYGHQLAGLDRGDVFSHLASLVLGGMGGLFANVTIAFACITTAIALVTVFATYVHRDLLGEKYPYLHVLIGTIVTSVFMSNIGFEGIAIFAGFVFMTVYPALMMLSLVNIANVFWGFSWIKTPVFMTLAGTLFIQCWPYLGKIFY